MAKRARQAVRKGNNLIFHWRGGYLTKEVLRELMELLEQAALQKEKHARIHLNWPQAVLEVAFLEAPPQESLVLEKANEGEE